MSGRRWTRWRRRQVIEVLIAWSEFSSCLRSICRLDCGHVVFRRYSMAIGQTAYCGSCGADKYMRMP